MRAENQKLQKNHGQFLFHLLVILLTVIIVTAGGGFTYSQVTDRIIDTSLQSMDELANHDEQAINSSLHNKWNILTGIAEHIRQQKCNTTEDLLVHLSSSRLFLNSIRLTLITDEGDTANSNMVLSNEQDLLALCLESQEHFIYNKTDILAQTEGRGEVLLLGVKITPFTVEDKTYTYILTRMDIDTLQDELKIDCYEGRGYSSVIDMDGRYIVKNTRSYTIQQTDNFYRDLEKGILEKDIQTTTIRERMLEKESFHINFTMDGTPSILFFTPMSETDWYYVISVPRQVFEEQSASLIRLFLALLLLIFLALILIVVVVLRRRKRLYLMEQKHKEELANALVLAQQANRAKTTFLNNMSHDIRTPMNAIIGFTALASTHIDNQERVRDYLGKISQSSNHLLSLINDVLDMSRIESGKMIIEEKPENLAEILSGLRNIVLSDIHSRQQEFFIDTVDVTDEDIFCDKLRLNQVLLNLLSNAVKFTNPGGTISIRILETAVKENGYATYQFRVKDNGIGMSREFAKTIFEPFTRERDTTVSGIQGTGLGMSITKNIVDLMGGTIEVNSELNKGTEFIVTLDFKLQQGHQDVEVIQNLNGCRGLVVDDDVNACQSVSQMLRQIGMRAEWTMYGKEAVVRTEEALKLGDCYQVYIIDWLMPDMNGIETARRIRKIVGNEAPIIILSAYDWGDIEDEAREAGVTGFISKPLFVSDLRRTLMKLCGTLSDEAPAVTEAAPNFRGKRLLLVEDNELNREIATELLQEVGFLIESAENGQEAVDAVKNSAPGHFDAILMDIQMPVMNGYDAARQIRALEHPVLSKIPIIAMTANAFEEDKQAAYDAGMNAHVGKPIDIPLLFQALSQIL